MSEKPKKLSERISADDGKDFLAALSEWIDECPGFELRLPGREPVWLHTDLQMKQWLVLLTDRIPHIVADEQEWEAINSIVSARVGDKEGNEA